MFETNVWDSRRNKTLNHKHLVQISKTSRHTCKLALL